MESITQRDLRDACADLHNQAETTKLAQELINGTINPMIYKNYCYQLYLIAAVIEAKMNFIQDLCRRDLLVMDVAECPSGAITACPSTIEYVAYLSTQFNPQLHGQLKGHIYAHYLGWLYGGQLIAKRLDLPKHHLKFNNVKACVDYVRNVQLGMIFDRDADEAKKAFEYTIKIYKELYELH
jgi:heme oxygenase